MKVALGQSPRMGLAQIWAYRVTLSKAPEGRGTATLLHRTYGIITKGER